MTDKTVEKLDVEVDELGLSLLGWDVEGRGRLLTRKSDDNYHAQRVAISVTAKFFPEDWDDRFTRFGDEGDDAEVPQLLLTLNRSASDLIPGCVELLGYLTNVKEVGESALRLSEKSGTWLTEDPIHADEIELRISAFDLSITRLPAWLLLPPMQPKALPIEIIDETRVLSITTHVTSAKADLGLRVTSGIVHKPSIRVRLEGAFEVLSEQLAESPRTRSGGVAVPSMKLEVLDDEGFLLDTEKLDFYCVIPIVAATGAPRRQPRWVVHWEKEFEDYVGEPTHLSIRIQDSGHDW